MIQEIKIVEDVNTFFNELLAEDLNFHPDDRFEDYINCRTKEPNYSEDEADLRNHLLDQSFEVCDKYGADIYELCIEIFMKDFYELYPPEV